MIVPHGPARRSIRKRRNKAWFTMLVCFVLWGVLTKSPMMIPGEPTRFNTRGPVPIIVHQPTEFWEPSPLDTPPVVATVEEQPLNP